MTRRALSIIRQALPFGHRGITPQRYAKDEAVSQKEAKGAADAAANALRGLKVRRCRLTQ
jgi:hypothetical protein